MTDAPITLILRRHARPGARGYLYDVYLDDELICTSRDPERAACRVLAERGLAGEVRFRRAGREAHDISIADLRAGAGAFVRESASDGPRLAPYAPYRSADRKHKPQAGESGACSGEGCDKEAPGSSTRACSTSDLRAGKADSAQT